VGYGGWITINNGVKRNMYNLHNGNYNGELDYERNE
jgi:hypothetical protein